MNQLKMDIAMTGHSVPSLTIGDDGEAVSKIEQTRAESSSSLGCSAECSRFSVKIKEDKASDSEQEPQRPKDAGWYVAVVRCNCENNIAKAIDDSFRRKNIWFEYWVPMRKIVYIDKRSNKRRVKEKVLVTTFVFCHVSAGRLNEIRFRSDVYKMLTMPGQRDIYRISDKEMEDYRRIVENPDLPVTPCSGPLHKGQKVRITEGNMAGLEAFVQRVSGKKATIGNEIKFISGATIEIDRSFLEVIDE